MANSKYARDSKYAMFRNIMYNELGITKEDIRQWVREAVFEIADRYVSHELSNYTISDRVRTAVAAVDRNDIKNQIAAELKSRLEIEVKVNNG